MEAEGARGHGVLILVAGPSGAGKDTLISAVERSLGGNPDFVFPKRFITREDQIGEEHIFIPEGQFSQLQADGGFFLDWRAHGHCYGVPVSTLADLNAGRAVIVNVSRRIIAEARGKWSNTHVISVVVAAESLRNRLRSRGRESDAEIEERIRRAFDPSCAIPAPAHILDNSGPLSEAATRFTGLVLMLSGRSLAPEAVTADQLETAAVLRLA
jgi:ribose 1,5-bisphosphokinase